jgi:alpha-beta hydrolase superfamily lysophospholipase
MVLPLVVGGMAIAALDLARRIFRHAQLFSPSPNPARSWNPADYGVSPEAIEEHWFETSDGELLYGWYCRSPRPVASAVFCHGNTGNLTTSADVIPHLLAAGINVLSFDYRGFGRSSGIPSINGVVSDGVTAARFHDTIRPKSLPSILYGYSLGGAVAAQVIKRHAFAGLILQSTFTSLPKLARVHFPRFPMHLFTGDLFDTLNVMRCLTVPLLVVHGGADEVVPCSMARELYEACSAAKNIQIVDEGLHKDLFTRDFDSVVWAVNRFAANLPNGSKHIPLEAEGFPDTLVHAALRSIRRLIRRLGAVPQTAVVASAAVSHASRRQILSR